MASTNRRLPPRQQLAAPGKWPAVGERAAVGPVGPWRVVVGGEVASPLDLSLDQLRALPRVERTIDIHCVTRWSKPEMRFAGVTLACLLDIARPHPEAKFVSFVAYSARNHSTSLPLADAIALETLIVWEFDGAPLPAEHGGPVRVVVPSRYFYKSLKWLRAIEVLAIDKPGYWESEAGYHNTGDPWREERYMAPQLTRQEMRAAFAARDSSGRDLRSIDARGHDLSGLRAQGALLRDANFQECRLAGAIFDDANLSNAHFAGAVLAGASFARADVEGADFSGADLRGANFTGASLFGVTFGAVEAGQSSRPAIADATTRIDAAGLEALVPLQAQLIRRLLACG
ncbi:MAG TPA: molybdopterin-dependent oxidoreductase [Pirellulales bacterium]|nr:molybdopterin-dependent oxidoreductase [Pirellulales bacterium]